MSARRATGWVGARTRVMTMQRSESPICEADLGWRLLPKDVSMLRGARGRRVLSVRPQARMQACSSAEQHCCV